jgi:hypothetical protein
MIPAVIGALLGLYFLFRGCILLQRRATGSIAKTQVLTELVSATTIFSTQSQEPTRSTTREVIRLSSDDASAGTNTQQGKIAAALLKAGVTSPTSWTATQDRPPVDLAGEQTVRSTIPGNLVQSLDLNASKVLKKAASNAAPHTFSEGTSVQPFHWKSAVMVWGGPIVTLACLYILALHFGWL